MAHRYIPPKKKPNFTHATRKPKIIAFDEAEIELRSAAYYGPDKPLTNRARRKAKKRFKKKRAAPSGMHLLYATTIDTSPRLSPSAIKQNEIANTQAQVLFHKNYFNLTSAQQTKVFETLNEGEKKTEWSKIKSRVN